MSQTSAAVLANANQKDLEALQRREAKVAALEAERMAYGKQISAIRQEAGETLSKAERERIRYLNAQRKERIRSAKSAQRALRALQDRLKARDDRFLSGTVDTRRDAPKAQAERLERARKASQDRIIIRQAGKTVTGLSQAQKEEIRNTVRTNAQKATQTRITTPTQPTLTPAPKPQPEPTPAERERLESRVPLPTYTPTQYEALETTYKGQQRRQQLFSAQQEYYRRLGLEGEGILKGAGRAVATLFNPAIYGATLAAGAEAGKDILTIREAFGTESTPTNIDLAKETAIQTGRVLTLREPQTGEFTAESITGGILIYGTTGLGIKGAKTSPTSKPITTPTRTRVVSVFEQGGKPRATGDLPPGINYADVAPRVPIPDPALVNRGYNPDFIFKSTESQTLLANPRSPQATNVYITESGQLTGVPASAKATRANPIPAAPEQFPTLRQQQNQQLPVRTDAQLVVRRTESGNLIVDRIGKADTTPTPKPQPQKASLTEYQRELLDYYKPTRSPTTNPRLLLEFKPTSIRGYLEAAKNKLPETPRMFQDRRAQVTLQRPIGRAPQKPITENPLIDTAQNPTTYPPYNPLSGTITPPQLTALYTTPATPLTGTITTQRVTQRINYDTETLPAARQLPTQKAILEPENKQTPISSFKTTPQRKPSQTPITTPASAQTNLTIQDTQQDTDTPRSRPLYTPPTRPRNIPRTYNPPQPPIFPRLLTKPNRERYTPTPTNNFIVTIGKPGNVVYQELGTGGTALIKKARDIVRGGAAASIRIQGNTSQSEILRLLGKGFAKSKKDPLRYIQKRETRINTRGEYQDITLKGRKKRQRNLLTLTTAGGDIQL